MSFEAILKMIEDDATPEEIPSENDEDKPQCRYCLTVCKCPISSQTIKYRYKSKSNQFFLGVRLELVSVHNGLT